MIQTCNCRCCQLWEAEIANYIHKSLVEKEWVRKEDIEKNYIAKKGAIYMDKNTTLMEMMGYIRKDSLATEEEIEDIISLKLSQMIVEDKPDRLGYTKAKVLAQALLGKIPKAKGVWI